jgi:hypothetical protein
MLGGAEADEEMPVEQEGLKINVNIELLFLYLQTISINKTLK